MAIHQELTIDSSPKEVYQTLTDDDKFSTFTEAPANFDSTDGGVFSAFDGQITGRNIELIDNKMIVQAWRVTAWPSGIYSIVNIQLDAESDKTILTLDHTGYPDDFAKHLDDGWHKMYWAPLNQYLGK